MPKAQTVGSVRPAALVWVTLLALLAAGWAAKTARLIAAGVDTSDALAFTPATDVPAAATVLVISAWPMTFIAAFAGVWALTRSSALRGAGAVIAACLLAAIIWEVARPPDALARASLRSGETVHGPLVAAGSEGQMAIKTSSGVQVIRHAEFVEIRAR